MKVTTCIRLANEMYKIQIEFSLTAHCTDQYFMVVLKISEYMH